MGKGFLGRDFWDKEFGGCAGCRHKSEDGSYKNYCDKYPNGKPDGIMSGKKECFQYETVRNLWELHKDDICITTKEYCTKCKGCELIDEYGYDATCCEKYPNPGDKPDEIINEDAECKYYKKHQGELTGKWLRTVHKISKIDNK